VIVLSCRNCPPRILCFVQYLTTKELLEETELTHYEYDLISVGGGPAGLVASVGASHVGLKPALLEHHRLGGDCLWTGCIPSKSLLASSHLAHAMKQADDLGLRSMTDTQVANNVLKRMRDIRSRIALKDSPQSLSEKGVDSHFGPAHFIGPNTLEVEGVGIFKSKRIVLATGAKPSIPSIRGLEKSGYLTYETVCDLEEYPQSIGIIGAGPVGIELAQTFNRLGSNIVIFEVKDRILNQEDSDVSVCLTHILRKEGIQIHLESPIEKISVNTEDKKLVTSGGQQFIFDNIVVATGRNPAIHSLNLEVANIELDDGIIRTQPTLATSNKHVWAVGDVNGGPQYTNFAEYSAATAVRNTLLPFPTSVDFSCIPHVLFTDPEIAHVGLTTPEVECRGGRTFRIEFEELDRAITEGKPEGFMKISVDRRGRILGSSIIGYRAGELIQPIVLAMKHGLTLSQIADTSVAYPTMGEGLKRSAMAYQKSRLDSPLGMILKKCIIWLK